MGIEVIYHYGLDDPECNGDYHECELWCNNQLVLHLGDFYHDKSSYQVKGFLACLKFMKEEFTLKEIAVSDIDV